MAKYTVALFDADGVVIKPRDKFFTQRLVDDYSVSPMQADAFVHDVIVPALTDGVDLKQVLPTYIKAWKLQMSVDELLSYWWSGEETPDQAVLAAIDGLRKKQVKVFLASDQEKYKAAHLMQDVGLGAHFNGAFFSYSVKHTKAERPFWDAVFKKLQVRPDEILYWDDDQKNVDFAARLGVTAHFYSNPVELERQITDLGV